MALTLASACSDRNAAVYSPVSVFNLYANDRRRCAGLFSSAAPGESTRSRDLETAPERRSAAGPVLTRPDM